MQIMGHSPDNGEPTSRYMRVTSKVGLYSNLTRIVGVSKLRFTHNKNSLLFHHAVCTLPGN